MVKTLNSYNAAIDRDKLVALPRTHVLNGWRVEATLTLMVVNQQALSFKRFTNITYVVGAAENG